MQHFVTRNDNMKCRLTLRQTCEFQHVPQSLRRPTEHTSGPTELPQSFKLVFTTTYSFKTDVFLRSALIWDITQRRVVMLLPTFRDNVSVPPSRFKTSNLTLGRWGRHCVISQKSADVINMAAEAWSHECFPTSHLSHINSYFRHYVYPHICNSSLTQLTPHTHVGLFDTLTFNKPLPTPIKPTPTGNFHHDIQAIFSHKTRINKGCMFRHHFRALIYSSVVVVDCRKLGTARLGSPEAQTSNVTRNRQLIPPPHH
jgi:hypothetical protein